MKALIALALMALPASADEPERNRYCRAWSDMARDVMTTRQSGTAAVDAMDQYIAQNPSQRAIYTDLILAAYKEPGYQSEDAQTRMITTFGDLAWVECMTHWSVTDQPDQQ